MRKRRQLAPWHRKGLDAGGLEPVDEAVAAALAALEGKAAIYHCVSRVVNRERVLRREERDVFVEIMRRYEAFSQVHVLTHCVMPNPLCMSQPFDPQRAFRGKKAPLGAF